MRIAYLHAIRDCPYFSYFSLFFYFSPKYHDNNMTLEKIL